MLLKHWTCWVASDRQLLLFKCSFMIFLCTIEWKSTPTFLDSLLGSGSCGSADFSPTQSCAGFTMLPAPLELLLKQNKVLVQTLIHVLVLHVLQNIPMQITCCSLLKTRGPSEMTMSSSPKTAKARATCAGIAGSFPVRLEERFLSFKGIETTGPFC